MGNWTSTDDDDDEKYEYARPYRYEDPFYKRKRRLMDGMLSGVMDVHDEEYENTKIFPGGGAQCTPHHEFSRIQNILSNDTI